MKPTIEHSKLLYSGFFDLRQDLLKRHDGLTREYTSLILSTHAVVILAQTAEGLWILNREYRHPTGETLLGPPGGKMEEGEDSIFSGQRELFEETGYWSDEIQPVGCCHPFPGISDQKIYYLWAQNCIKKGEQNLEPFEFIQVELKTDKQLREEIRQSSHIDGNLCIALWYKDHFC